MASAPRYSPGRPRNGKPGKLPSQSTVKNVVAYMRMFFKASDAAQRLDRASPMLALKTADVIGRRKRNGKTYLTDAEVELLIAEIGRRNPGYVHIVHLLAETGLRSGEARGLVWANVAEHGFFVDLQATQDGSRRVEPKTPSSKRFVAYTTATRQLVAEQRQWLVDTYGEDAVESERPVFPTSSGRMLHASNLAHRVSEAADRCGLPATSPHSLRHYAAKRLLRNGVSLDVVAAVLGHATTTTTTSIYSDPTASPEEKADAMLRAFG
jgi:integrase